MHVQKADSPKDAQEAEENDAKYDAGSPGLSGEAENMPDQKEKPGKAAEGQEAEEESAGEQPTNIGEARKEAKVCNFEFASVTRNIHRELIVLQFDREAKPPRRPRPRRNSSRVTEDYHSNWDAISKCHLYSEHGSRMRVWVDVHRVLTTASI